MQMHSVETSAGTAIWWAPSRIAGFDLLALLQVPVDVLDRHRGVVHQNSDRERQAAQRHDVDGLADRRQADDRRQHRQRDRDRDDQRAAPASPGTAGS